MSRVSLRDSQQKEAKDLDLDIPRQANTPSTQSASNGSAHSVSSVLESPTESAAANAKEPSQSDDPHESHKEETNVLEPEHDSIQLLAYFLWQERGASHGSPDDDWFKARNELQARLQQQR